MVFKYCIAELNNVTGHFTLLRHLLLGKRKFCKGAQVLDQIEKGQIASMVVKIKSTKCWWKYETVKGNIENL